MITVMKFGGTSVGSPAALRRVAKIIAEEKDNKVVVTSAMSGITNFLAGSVNNIPRMNAEIINEFEKKHIEVANELFDEEHMRLFMEEYTPRIETFKSIIDNETLRKNPYFHDNVVSQGERFSSLILSHLLKSMGHKSIALTSEDCGIIAEGKPLSGYANLLKSEELMGLKVKPYLDRGCIPIITGYYGINEDGIPLTFGRGGSDYSSAVIANALNADMLEIWTDVDGFMSTDPRIVPNAIKIDEMNFGEAAELAYFGAKVLHPRTIEPVRMKHIPLKIKNSFKPNDSGTLIHHLRKSKDEVLRSVATKMDMTIISISSAEIALHPEIVAKLISKIAENEVAIYSISTSLSTVALLISNKDVKATLMKLNSIEDYIEGIEVKGDVALICAVGDNLISRCGVSADIFAVVRDAGANLEMISEGASDVSLNFVIPMSKVKEVIKALHAKFVEEAQI